MAVHADALQRLVPAIYEASCHDAGWSELAVRIGDVFGGAAVGIDSNGGAMSAAPIVASVDFETALRDLHYEGYDTPEANPGVAALMRAGLGQPFALQSFVDRDIYDRDPSIRAILHPQKIDKGLFVTCERGPGVFSFMSVFRRNGQADFDTDHTRALAVVAGHVTRALAYRRLRLGRHIDAIAAAEALRRSTRLEGTVILSPSRAVVHADARAELLLERRLGFAVRQGRLVALGSGPGQDDESLTRYLGHTEMGEHDFAVHAPDGIATLSCLPVSIGTRAEPGGPCRLAVLRYVGIAPTLDTGAFAAAYGLTRAERRVVEALSRFATATDAADALGISQATMKTHLRNIYDKTGAPSLARLMLLVGRFA